MVNAHHGLLVLIQSVPICTFKKMILIGIRGQRNSNSFSYWYQAQTLMKNKMKREWGGAPSREGLPETLHLGLALTCNRGPRCPSRPPCWQPLHLTRTHLSCLHLHLSLRGLPPSSQEVKTVTLIGQPKETADLVGAVGELGGKVKKRNDLWEGGEVSDSQWCIKSGSMANEKMLTGSEVAGSLWESCLQDSE